MRRALALGEGHGQGERHAFAVWSASSKVKQATLDKALGHPEDAP
jgi:hypothetical protein